MVIVSREFFYEFIDEHGLVKARMRCLDFDEYVNKEGEVMATIESSSYNMQVIYSVKLN